MRVKNTKNRITAALTVTALLFATVILAVLGVQQQPRITGSTASLERLIKLPNQRLVLQLNQATEPVRAEAVKITPDVPHSVRSDARTVTITFERPLLADTVYRFAVDTVSQATGARGSTSYEVKTPTMRAEILTQYGGQIANVDAGATLHDDKITAFSVRGGSPTVWLTEQRLSEFASAGEWFAAVQQLSEQDSRLLVGKAGGEPKTVLMPNIGGLRQPMFSDDASQLGIKFAEDYDFDALYLFTTNNISNGSGVPVRYPDGSSVPVADWFFEPGTANVRILTPAGETLLAPLGGTAAADERPWPQQDDGAPRDIGAPRNSAKLVSGQSLSISDRTLLLTAAADADSGADSAAAAAAEPGADSGAEVTQLFQPAAESTTVDGFCLSPNEQYVAVIITASTGEKQVAIVEIGTGLVVQNMPGSWISWCLNTVSG